MADEESGDDRPLETGWLADTPVEDNLFRKFLHNQAELNELLAASVEGGRSARTDAEHEASRRPGTD